MNKFSLIGLLLLIGISINAQNQIPEPLQKVLKAHGGLDEWRSMQGLQYDIERKGGDETHQIHLWDRRDKVEAPNFSLGYDGKQIWLNDKTGDYKGNAIFYHNLMFYFYAMPFVLADDGINYAEATPLQFEGKEYPGIHISYQAEVGASPEDEYFIYYHPKTFQMEWLGYTVTYFSKEKSSKIKWIRYNDWAEVDGFVLPKSMTWYNIEEGKPTTAKSSTAFKNVKVIKEGFAEGTFKKPENAVVVE